MANFLLLLLLFYLLFIIYALERAGEQLRGY
jgi:hypothetical protein